MALIHYLLVYDHTQEQLIELREFTDAEEAAAAYAELEQKHRGNSALEIVLVGADSIDTIRQTHGNYFNGDSDAPITRLAGAPS
jgi:hypothetical protein